MAGKSSRGTGLRVHRWLGLAIGLIAVVLALSGAILAAAPMLERVTSPARFRISGEQRLGASSYVDAAYRRLRPGERIATLSLEQGSAPVVITLDRTSDRAQRRLFLDPPTARVLASGWRDGSMVGVARRLHDGLFLSGLGRWVVGLGGLGMLLANLTGLWTQAFRKASKTKAKRGRTDTRMAQWHRRVGLWSAVPVLAMTATGLALTLSPGSTLVRTAPPVARPSLPVARVVASAQRWSHGTLLAIDWPTERSPDWTLHFDGSEPSVVKVADDSAKALAAPAYATPVMLSWVRQLHAGQAMPWIWHPLATLTGVLAAWIAVTGMIAWATRPKVRRARR